MNASAPKVTCRICQSSSHLDCLNPRMQCGPKCTEGDFVCRCCRVHLAYPNIVLERRIGEVVYNVSKDGKKTLKFRLKVDLKDDLNNVMLSVSTNCIDFEAECIISALLPCIKVSLNGSALKSLDELTLLDRNCMSYKLKNVISFEIDSGQLLKIAVKDKMVDQFINDNKSCLIFSLFTASEILFDNAVGYSIMNCSEYSKDANLEFSWHEHFSWFCDNNVLVPAVCRCGSLEDGICLRKVIISCLKYKNKPEAISNCRSCNRKLVLANLCVNTTALTDYFGYFQSNVMAIKSSNKEDNSRLQTQSQRQIRPEELFPSFKSKQPEKTPTLQQTASILMPIRKKTEESDIDKKDNRFVMRRQSIWSNSVDEAQNQNKRVKEDNFRQQSRTPSPNVPERDKLFFSSFKNLVKVSFIKEEISVYINGKGKPAELDKYSARWLDILCLTNTEASKKDICEWMQFGWFAAEELSAYNFDDQKVSQFSTFIASILSVICLIDAANFILRRTLTGMMHFFSGQKSLTKENVSDIVYVKMTSVLITELNVVHNYLYRAFFHFMKRFDRDVAYESMKRTLVYLNIRDPKLLSKITKIER